MLRDEEGIIAHLRELDEALSDWERYRAVSYQDFQKNRDTRNMVLHALLIGIQATIDIANHLIAGEDLRRPSTYRESFVILSERGVLTPELGEAMGDLAGFRNVLVHIYWRLNLEEVYRVLQNDLPVVREYEAVVKGCLKES
ncbi:MAG: hypothetical protein PWP08_1009 [Methanofollis sp.]|nr:hypothetical protein [Methanofollis sp.]